MVDDNDDSDTDDSDADNGDNDNTGDIDSYNKVNLDLHNHYRSLHVDTPPLEFSQELADAAYAWSSHLVEIGRLQHDRNSGHGENLGWNTWSGRADDWATRAWYETEIDDYDYNNPGFSFGAGHFTQIVWVGTEKVGCAEVGEYTTCRYYPPGNINTAAHFRANVKPLKE